MENTKNHQEQLAEAIANGLSKEKSHYLVVSGTYGYVTQTYQRHNRKEEVIRICKLDSDVSQKVHKIEKELAEMFLLDDDGTTRITEATAKRICEVLNTLENVPESYLPIIKMLASDGGAWANLIMYSHKLATENQELRDWKAQAEIGHNLMKEGNDFTEKSLQAHKEELQMIREYIGADPEESTYDEVVRRLSLKAKSA